MLGTGAFIAGTICKEKFIVTELELELILKVVSSRGGEIVFHDWDHQWGKGHGQAMSPFIVQDLYWIVGPVPIIIIINKSMGASFSGINLKW
jgi:hypothetical protein